MVKREIVWSKLANKQFANYYQEIFKESVQSAEKAKSEILRTINKIPENPERYPLDKYRKNNDGTIRALEIFRYRIAYQVIETQIRILRIRHTSKSPRNY